MNTKYLSNKHLTGFEYYKYSSIDNSPLSVYVMHPFWNQVVKLVPHSIAPNVLTFTGFMFTVTNGLLLAYFDFNFCASSDSIPECPPIPNWVWLVCAFNQFLAHTLDGIDGKHARQTNTSGPLGELMDHGIDSWAALFMSCCFYSIFGRKDYSFSPLRVFFLIWSVNFCFYLSHWEKYNTGILYLPWGYDLSQVVILISYLLTFFFTYSFWKFVIPVFGLTSSEFFEILIYLGTLGFTIPTSLYNIFCGYRAGTLKQPTLMDGIRPLVPVILLFMLTFLWTIVSPNNIVEASPRIFFYLVGTLFSNIACRLIISQMTSTRCELVNFLLWPLGLVVLLAWLIPSAISRFELHLLNCLTLFVVLAHIHYGVSVVRQLCDHFKIRCFSIKPSAPNKSYVRV